MIKVLNAGIYSSIQDLGRLGFAKMGIPLSGAMDRFSSRLGNIILKNRKSDAVIEVTFGMAKFEFTSNTFICLTGGDFSPKLNDEFLEMQTVYEVKKGSILSFGKRKYGARIYIAVQGGIQSETILKSRSFFGGITSKVLLEKGDELPILSQQPYDSRGFAKVKIVEEHFGSSELECFPGPEFDLLNQEQKKRLLESFTISEDNNRMGYRLSETIENNFPSILTSAVLPGTVQLTPSGKLIVLMRDCQVTGGYPRVLQLSEYGISSLGQKISGETIGFQLN